MNKKPVIILPTNENQRRPVTIVVLSRYKEIFTPFYESYLANEVTHPMIIVKDGNEDINPNNFGGITLPVSREVIQGPEKFSMAGNGNIGLKAVPSTHDILYCGDDIRFLEKDTILKLQEAAYKFDNVGIVSPRIIGRGSPAQVNPAYPLTQITAFQMWFPCVYIKRAVIDKIGYLDEQFSDFGSDDLDFCIRTQIAGYKLAVTNSVAVVHEASPEGGPSTFVKKIGAEAWHKQEAQAQEKLRAKYNVAPITLQTFLKTGNIELLTQRPPLDDVPEQTGLMEVSRAEAMDFLRKQHIFIATPCYGGMMTVNYTNALIALMNQCHNYGIKYTISFVHNESLITRARNKLANDFVASTATHLVFIDADIGFDPKDIITFLLYKADIIGIPCARKNLRVDRVADTVTKNERKFTMEKLSELKKEVTNGASESIEKLGAAVDKTVGEIAGFRRIYTIPELENLMGEFVVNLPVDSQRTSIDIGALTEVMDVGTGLMCIKRTTLEKFKIAYPDREYLQMNGEEGGRKPVFMYFQAGFDEDSKSYNPGGLPDYVSEDYWFCRDARRAGMKVYLAPWAVSSHMGAYMFKGDMRAVGKSGGNLR